MKWTTKHNNLSLDNALLAFGNRSFVAIASGYAYVSWDDGTTWTANIINAASPALKVKCVHYADGKFVALSRSYAHVSTNGRTWKNTKTSIEQPANLAHFQGAHYTISEDHAYKSVDGTTWTPIPLETELISTTGIDFGKIAASNKTAVVAGSWGNPSLHGPKTTVCVRSTNGSKWNRSGYFQSKCSCRAIEYGDDTFVAAISDISTSKTSVAVSTDEGISWDPHIGGSVPILVSDICFGDDQFLMLGAKTIGTLHLSKDNGLNWTKQTEVTEKVLGITYGNGIFMAMGKSFVVVGE